MTIGIGEPDDGSEPHRRASPIPSLVSLTGLALFSVAVVYATSILRGGGSALEALLDFVFVGVPGIAFMYTGRWMPRSKLPRHYYFRIVTWIVGTVAVMYGFILLRDLHPGVSVEWSIGTQAIALTIGSLGGLLIGVQETKAKRRTVQLEKRTEELEANERALERQNEQLEKFASVVSHDLRNPLGVARGNLELAREECDSDRLDRIEAAHERMDTLIDDLLALARQGDSINALMRVDITTLAESCWRNVGTGDGTLAVGDVRPVMADRDRLQQLLENLIRNSVEHGSTSSRTQSDDSVEHGSTNSQPAASDSGEDGRGDVTVTIGEIDDGEGFYVADDGPGIPREKRGRVFESGYSSSESGTGFGLAIVKEIVEAHGWRIDATESEDGGARFEITGVEFADEASASEG